MQSYMLKTRKGAKRCAKTPATTARSCSSEIVRIDHKIIKNSDLCLQEDYLECT